MNVLFTLSKWEKNQRTSILTFKITDLKDERFSCIENNGTLTQISELQTKVSPKRKLNMFIHVHLRTSHFFNDVMAVTSQM
jgi:hypothetical protein